MATEIDKHGSHKRLYQLQQLSQHLRQLYGQTTGLVDVALEAKKYVKSVFGATSPQFKQVSKLEFTRHRKK